MAKPDLTAERLREILDYDSATGIFTWKVRTSIRIIVGKRAGTIKKDNGYVHIGIDGTQYRAHRLAWLYVYGEWPSDDVDHKDTIRHHNWIDNLRVLPNAINGQNRRRPQADNRLGVLGVFRCKGKYQAQVKLRGKITHIGTFDTPEQAHAAYVEAKRRIHEGCTL